MMNRFSIKDIELLTGIKQHTLRIWELRYGLPNPKRTDTNIRSYSDLDLKLLLNVSILNRNGLKISKITSLSREQMDKMVLDYATNADNFSLQSEALITAMLNLDEVAFEKTLSSCILKSDFEKTMIDVIFPFLRRAGVLWQTGTINPAYEHFLTNLVRRKLIVAIDALPLITNPTAKKFLLFLPQEEFHEIGLLFSKYLLRKYGHKTMYLGQNLPAADAESVNDIFKANYVVTALTTSLKNGSVQKFINDLSGRFSKSKIIVSGFQVVGKALKPPSNVIVVKEFSEMAELAANC